MKKATWAIITRNDFTAELHYNKASGRKRIVIFNLNDQYALTDIRNRSIIEKVIDNENIGVMSFDFRTFDEGIMYYGEMVKNKAYTNEMGFGLLETVIACAITAVLLSIALGNIATFKEIQHDKQSQVSASQMFDTYIIDDILNK
jgi:hypothetical protein